MRIFDRCLAGESRMHDPIPGGVGQIGMDGRYAISWRGNMIVSVGYNTQTARSTIRREGPFFARSWTLNRLWGRISRGGRLHTEPMFIHLDEVMAMYQPSFPEGSREEDIRRAFADLAANVYVNMDIGFHRDLCLDYLHKDYGQVISRLHRTNGDYMT